MLRSINHLYGVILPTKNKELKELYATLFLRTLAFGLVGIFIPLYMIQELNYSIQKTLFFFVIFDVAMAIATPIAAKASLHMGIKKIIFASIPFHIAYLVMLGLLGNYPALYYYAPIFSGIANGMFWIGFHSKFSEETNNHNGKEVGLIFAIPLLVATIGPILGAFIATTLSFNALYSTSSAILALSAIPLFLTKDKIQNRPIKLRNVFNNPSKDFLGYIANGMRDYASIILWPVFIFYSLGKYISIGIIGSGAALFNTIFALIIGKISDRMNKGRFLKIATIIDSATWLIRHLFKNIFSLFAITAVSTLSSLAMYIPYTAMTYQKLNAHNKMEYLIFREAGLFTGRIIILTFAIFFPLNYSFILIAAANFLFFLF